MAKRPNLYAMISSNKWKTGFFIITFSLLLGAVGYALGSYFNWSLGSYSLFGLFIVGYNLVLYFSSSKIALATNGARPADPDQFRQLHNIVEEVCVAAGIPKPGVYIIDADAPNAFATGRNPKHAAIAVTRGLLQTMNREEVQGVVAHEMAHVRNYDILLMTVVAILGGLLVLFRDVFLRGSLLSGGRRDSRDSRGGGGAMLVIVGIGLAILAPLVVALIRAAVSRQREYLADASGALIVRNPHGLSSALRKLGSYDGRLRTASAATAHMFIANPFGKDRGFNVADLFATHPPLEKRIARLDNLILPDAGQEP